jgi:hypothetical protein
VADEELEELEESGMRGTRKGTKTTVNIILSNERGR